MKAKAFLKLVEEMMDAQQDYFAAKRKGDRSQVDLLIRSKGIEKRVRDVIKDGKLEFDEPTATVHVYTTEQFQEELNLLAELRKQSELVYLQSADDKGETEK